MTTETQRVLKDFGLNENEIKVYLACLKEDDLSPFRIAKTTNIPRTTIYDILMGLSLKGLVELEQSDGFTKQQTRVKAKNPSVLRRILQDKRSNLIKLETDVVGILPFLKDDFHKSDPNADFQFYPGIEGFRQSYRNEDFGEIGIQRYSWDLLMPMDVVGMDVMNEIVQRQLRMEKQHVYEPHEIVALNDWTRHVISYQYGHNKDYLRTRQIRYIDQPGFELAVELTIIGSQIRVACADKKEVWGLVIVSDALSTTLKSIFMAQWLTAAPLTEEMVQSWGPNEMLKWEKKRTDLVKPNKI